MKKLSLIALATISSVSLNAGWLDSILGSKKKEEPAPAAPTTGLDLGSLTEQFGGSIMDYAKSSGDSLLTSLGGDLTTQVSSLASMIGQDPEAASSLASSLGNISGSLTTTNWTELLQGFSGLASGNLGEKEKASLTKTMELATAFGLQSFLQDTPYSKDVSSAVTSLKSGNYIEAIPPLKTVLDNAKLSDSQQAMIDSSIGYFSDLAQDKGASMLKDGLGSIFGK